MTPYCYQTDGTESIFCDIELNAAIRFVRQGRSDHSNFRAAGLLNAGFDPCRCCRFCFVI
jgi:hypothetical protein